MYETVAGAGTGSGRHTEHQLQGTASQGGRRTRRRPLRKRRRARAKFAEMKVHFDAGLAALEQAKATRMQMDKLPRDQQASLQGQFDSDLGHGPYRTERGSGSNRSDRRQPRLGVGQARRSVRADGEVYGRGHYLSASRGRQARSSFLQQPGQLPGQDRQGGRGAGRLSEGHRA